MKDELLSVLKHEFKTPLAIINGYCEILTQALPTDNLTKDQIESLTGIMKGVIDLNKTIDNLLSIYELENKLVKFNQKPINLSHFTKKIHESFLNKLEKKNVEFKNLVQDISVTYDPQRLEQIFTNLIENSIAFVQEKSGIIEVGSKDRGDYILLYVKDNGNGIPNDKIDKLFQKFFQVDSSQRRQHSGLGLGLAICREIIEQNAGKIWIESKENLGTTVYFTISKSGN